MLYTFFNKYFYFNEKKNINYFLNQNNSNNPNNPNNSNNKNKLILLIIGMFYLINTKK
jgi:hypothetical protein